MCQQLSILSDFVSHTPVTASLSDVIRIACGSCDKTEVCAYVTGNEFDAVKQTTTLSEPSSRPTPSGEPT